MTLADYREPHPAPKSERLASLQLEQEAATARSRESAKVRRPAESLIAVLLSERKLA